MSRLWSLPVLTVYFYTATVLTQLGFVSFFGIPSNFVEASIKQNILNFYILFQLTFAIFDMMRWWMIIAVMLVVAIVLFLSRYNSRYKFVLSIFGSGILILLLWGSYVFGGLIASNSNNFFVPSDDCILAGTSTKYIIPAFYDTKAILVPYDQNSHKILSGFMLKETSDLSCLLQRKSTGVLTR